MAYIELYKKYRPRVWDDIIGQDNVVNTLRTVPLTGKLPTSYMFFGTHGSGKTTSAFVLAKALNCENLQPDGNPCNVCETCKSIDSMSQPGIRYISMANQGSVDDVRKIVNDARLVQAIKKPVFILDECHRLSPAAWDALLIPMESETMPSLFIFCSTEPDKIPDTIKSRAQVRNFTPVNDMALGKNLLKIIKAENIKIDKEQVLQIVRASKGSVRDSISNLETLVSDGKIDGSYSEKVLMVLASGKYTALFNLTNEMNTNGESFSAVAQQLYDDLANILLVFSHAKINLSPASKAFGRVMTAGGVIGCLSILGDAITNMSYNTVSSRILFEIAMSKMLTGVRKSQQSASMKK